MESVGEMKRGVVFSVGGVLSNFNGGVLLVFLIYRGVLKVFFSLIFGFGFLSLVDRDGG